MPKKKTEQSTLNSMCQSAKKQTKSAKLKRIRGFIAYNDYVLFDGTEREYDGKHRAYFICTYRSLDECNALLINSAKTYAFITHDKDDKKSHNHFIVVFDNARQCKSICKAFSDSTLQTLISVAHDVKLCFDYMLHRDKKSVELNKFRYDVSEVITEDIAYFDRFYGKVDKVKKERDNEEFLNDLCADEINLRAMAIKYGRDFMKNYRNYMTFRAELLYQEDELQVDFDKLVSEQLEEIHRAYAEAQNVCDTYGVKFTDEMRQEIAYRVKSRKCSEHVNLLRIHIDIETGELR